MTSDLLWDDVREFFDPDQMGSLPDVCIPHTSVQDWQDLLDFVVTRSWRFEYSEGDKVVPLPPAEAILASAPGSDPSC